MMTGPSQPSRSLEARVLEASQAHQAAGKREALLLWAAANLEGVCRAQTYVQQHRLGQGEAYIAPFPAELGGSAARLLVERTERRVADGLLGGAEVEGVMISSTSQHFPCVFSARGYEPLYSPAELAPLNRCRSARQLGWHPLAVLWNVEGALKATQRLLAFREWQFFLFLAANIAAVVLMWLLSILLGLPPGHPLTIPVALGSLLLGNGALFASEHVLRWQRDRAVLPLVSHWPLAGAVSREMN